MPSRPTTGAWVLYILFGLGDQKEWSIEFWYSVFSGTPGPTWNPAPANAAIFNALTPTLVPALSTSWQILGGRFYANFGSGTIGDDGYDQTSGTDATDPLPEFTTVIVRKVSDTYTRPARGLWRIPGVCEDQTQGSYLNATGESTYANIGVAWQGNITDQGIVYAPATFSRKTGLLYPIRSCPVSGRLGTDRRRRFRF